MLKNKDFDSNCKRLAKEIINKASNPLDDSFYGQADVDVSPLMVEEIKRVGKNKYIREINRNLKNKLKVTELHIWGLELISFNFDEY